MAEVEDQAIAASLPLKIADAHLRAIAARRRIANVWSVLQNLDASYSYDRDDEELKRGGGFSLTLPIFGLGRPERLRAASEFRQALQERRAVEVEVRAQARMAAEQAEAARQLALFRRKTLLPISNAVYQGVVLEVNAGQIGVFQLLQAKRDNLEAGRVYIDALSDFWRAKAELESLLTAAPAPRGAP